MICFKYFCLSNFSHTKYAQFLKYHSDKDEGLLLPSPLYFCRVMHIVYIFNFDNMYT